MLSSIIYSTLFVSLASAQWAQVSYFTSSDCTGQPQYMYSSLNGLCANPANVNQNCQLSDGVVYGSTRTTCISSPSDISNLVQVYVAKYTYTDTSTCATNASSAQIFVGDAECHPAGQSKGVVTSWTLANCNYPNPYILTCTDSSCTQCTQEKRPDTCESLGAGASTQMKCIINGALSTPYDYSSAISQFPFSESLIFGTITLATLALLQ